MAGRHVPEKQNSTQRIPQNESRGGTSTGNEGPNLSSSSTADAMKKMDKDKAKAATPERRADSEGDAGGKVDAVGDDDLVRRELEHVVESVAGDDEKHDGRKSQPQPPHHREDHQNTAGTTESTAEEGEVSMDSQEGRSPERDDRKRKDAHEHGCHERDLKRQRE